MRVTAVVHAWPVWGSKSFFGKIFLDGRGQQRMQVQHPGIIAQGVQTEEQRNPVEEDGETQTMSTPPPRRSISR